MVSRKLFEAIKLHPTPQYRIALMFGIDPCWFSKALHGAVPVRPGDRRIVQVAQAVGIDPKDAFAEESRAAEG